MAPRRVEEIPVKRVAALGCKLPDQLPAGEILIDITQKKWRLGHTIGYGGFGDIYLGIIYHYNIFFLNKNNNNSNKQKIYCNYFYNIKS